ncbi:flagellar component of cell-proximal portion of basal-body rod [Enterobacter cancerogenus]|uniref:flagellar basal body rod protein FlgB n=1 Tax=Enterobacter cancerogenus TaxID=69218 RepID=UPI001926F1A0|nr:flagellar basal body rod protein FlgB [Enterobacter cancerogenus]CAD5358485.1 flagellar component of cell-proximal portion of basal-body rod [Enterobacter cancerogenus]
MLDKLDKSLRFQQQALNLLNQRQEILASNIANADTPGYLSRDIDFSQQLKHAVNMERVSSSSLSLKLTAEKHIPASVRRIPDSHLMYRIPDQPSADGNTVDMDRERVNFADNNLKYQSGLTFMGAEIKKMMNVISQG